MKKARADIYVKEVNNAMSKFQRLKSGLTSKQYPNSTCSLSPDNPKSPCAGARRLMRPRDDRVPLHSLIVAAGPLGPNMRPTVKYIIVEIMREAPR